MGSRLRWTKSGFPWSRGHAIIVDGRIVGRVLVKILSLTAALLTVSFLAMAPAARASEATPTVHGYGYDLYGSYRSYTFRFGREPSAVAELGWRHPRHHHRHHRPTHGHHHHHQ
jgi:hypothetical protein